MIQLIDKINIPTATDTGLYDVIIKIQDFTIQDGVRLLPPIDNAEYEAILLEIEAKELELAATSTTAIVTRERRMAERNALYTERDALMIRDEGVCTCSLRYFAANEEREINLPIQGITESFSCFVSELENFPSLYENVYMNKKHQMKQMVVRFLASSLFLGYTNESDFIIR
jgi:hypothetical protein